MILVDSSANVGMRKLNLVRIVLANLNRIVHKVIFLFAFLGLFDYFLLKKLSDASVLLNVLTAKTVFRLEPVLKTSASLCIIVVQQVSGGDPSKNPERDQLSNLELPVGLW